VIVECKKTSAATSYAAILVFRMVEVTRLVMGSNLADTRWPTTVRLKDALLELNASRSQLVRLKDALLELNASRSQLLTITSDLEFHLAYNTSGGKFRLSN
jgi:hypothetical protein